MDEIVALRNRRYQPTKSIPPKTITEEEEQKIPRAPSLHERIECNAPTIEQSNLKQAEDSSTSSSPQQERRPRTRKEILEIQLAGLTNDNRNDAMIWKTIFRYRFYIIVLWICIIFPIGLFCQPKLMKVTDSSYRALTNTPSHDAKEIYEKYYLPKDYDSINPPILILLRQEEENIGTNESMIDGTSDLYKSTKQFMNNYARYLRDYTTNKDDDKEGWITVENYYDLEVLDIDTFAKESYTRNDGSYMVLIVSRCFIQTGREMYNFLKDLKDYGNTFVPAGLSIDYTGMNIFQQDMVRWGIHDNLIIMTIVLPLVLVVVCFFLRGNVILVLLIPLTMSGITMTFWCILMWPLVRYAGYQVSQITPTIIWLICIIQIMTYSIQFLSRIQQELSSSSSPHGAIVTSLNKVYPIHRISNFAFLLCLFGYMLCPMEALHNFALAGCAAIIGCLLVELTLVPAILFTNFGHWVLLSSTSCVWNDVSNPCCCCRAKEKVDDILLNEPLITTDLPASSPQLYVPMESVDIIDSKLVDGTVVEPPQTLDSCTNDEIDRLQGGKYFLSGKQYIDHPKVSYVSSFIIIVLVLPMIYFLPEYKTSVKVQLTLPTDSAGLETYNAMSDVYQKGYLHPYKILFDGTDKHQKVTSSEGFDVMHDVYQQLTTRCNQRSSSDVYVGISVLNDTIVPYDTYETAMQNCSDFNSTSCDDEEYATIAYINSNYTANEYVSYILVTLAIDPYDSDGTDWLIDARSIIDDLDKQHKLLDINVYIEGGATAAYDSMHKTYKKLPRLIIVTSCIVLSFVAIVFKSAGTFLRTMLTILYTFTFSYGFSVLVYQKGCLNWLGLRSLSNDESEISFWSPILAFGIMLGLSMDYNVFTVSNIIPYRVDGYFHTSSILLGVQKSSFIITSTHLIMIIVFGGFLLLTSSTGSMALHQLSFLIVVAVLVNLCIIRPFVDPILMVYFTDYYTWWPRDLPLEEKDLLVDDEEEEGEDDHGFQDVRSEMQPLTISRSMR